MSIHLNILTNKSNIRFLKDIMEKNLETEIIEALKSGKEEAFRYIYKTYYTDLCRIARGYLTDSYLSESIVEDLVYSLWENRSKIAINTSLKNYLFRSVANKCINYLQLEYVKRETACSSEDLVIYSDLWSLGENPVEHLEGKELHAIIQKTINGLSPETRKVFLLSRFENKRQEEIAEIMGITIHTVKYHMRSALDKLKEAAKSYLALIVMFITNIFN